MRFYWFLLWSIAHAQAGQVPITEGEDNHEDDEETIVVEEDWQVETRLHVTQHEERDEDQAAHDGQGQQHTVLLWLWRHRIWMRQGTCI